MKTAQDAQACALMTTYYQVRYSTRSSTVVTAARLLNGISLLPFVVFPTKGSQSSLTHLLTLFLPTPAK